MSDELVKVEHLKQYFPAGGFGKNKKYVKAVDDYIVGIIITTTADGQLEDILSHFE